MDASTRDMSCLMHLPVERDSIKASSGILSRSISAALFRILPLSRAETPDHLPDMRHQMAFTNLIDPYLPSSKASLAEEIAIAMSVSVPAATLVTMTPLAGSSTSIYSPPSESTS